LGLLLIYGALFTETFAEYAVVFNNAWLMLPDGFLLLLGVVLGALHAFGLLDLAITGIVLTSHTVPAVVNALIALGGEFILPILLWMGNFLIDFAAALEPLQEYFPPPF
jgi:drug/metabolite transporter superfamily protein YnfA